MKKKFIAMLVAIVLAFPVVSISTASSAEADCGSYFARSGETGQFKITSGDAADSTYNTAPLMTYKLCDRKATVSNMYINLRSNNSYACTDHQVRGYYINGNVVGKYNPATQYRTCNNKQTNYQAYWNPTDFVVRRGAAENKRCFGGEIRLDLIGRSDRTFGTFSVCIPGIGQRVQ